MSLGQFLTIFLVLVIYPFGLTCVPLAWWHIFILSGPVQSSVVVVHRLKRNPFSFRRRGDPVSLLLAGAQSQLTSVRRARDKKRITEPSKIYSRFWPSNSAGVLYGLLFLRTTGVSMVATAAQDTTSINTIDTILSTSSTARILNVKILV